MKKYQVRCTNITHPSIIVFFARRIFYRTVQNHCFESYTYKCHICTKDLGHTYHGEYSMHLSDPVILSYI